MLFFSSFTNNGIIIGGLTNHADASNSGTIYIKAGDFLGNLPGANDGFFVNGGKIIDAGGISNGLVNEFDSPGGVATTPEPSTYLLWGTVGLLGIGIWVRRKFRGELRS